MKFRLSYILAAITSLVTAFSAMAQTTNYVVNESKEYSIGLGNNSDPIALNGPGKEISFQAKRQTGAFNYGFTLQISTDNGKSWSDYKTLSVSTSYQNFNYDLDANVTHVRFKHVSPGSLTKYARNVKVTRATTISASTSSVNLGETQPGKTISSQDIEVSYNTTYSTVNITASSSNPLFAVTGTTPVTAATGKISVKVSYSPTSVGEHSAVITLKIGSTTTASTTINVSGSCVMTKTTPTFTWRTTSVFTNRDYPDIFSTTNEDCGYTIISSDPSKATVSDNTLHVYENTGYVTFTVRQEGNEQWNAKEENYTVTIAAPQNHLPFTLSESNYNNYVNGPSSGSIGWAADDYSHTGLRLGDGGGGLNWDDKYRTLEFIGIPDKLTFNAGCTSGSSTGVKWYIQESPDGTSWETRWNSTELRNDNQSVQLSPTTRYLKICYSGNFGGVFSDFSVSELKYFDIDKNEIQFGDVFTSTIVEPQTIILSHCNAAGSVTVSNSNSTDFEVSPLQINSAGGDRMGTETITVRYLNLSEGRHNATITISDGVNTKTVNVSAGTLSSTFVLDPHNPSVPDCVYPSVKMNKTLPAGYSTIALPFDTSIEQISGNGNDKVFTLCNVSYTEASGYTFYFTEVEGGVIAAGQPYVIFLNAEVENPSWENITCGELSAVTISRGGWDFVSNFQANTSMTGKYGVVNSKNKIMKGGAGATLNAFTAYFRLNAQTKASVHDSTIPAGAIPLFSVTVRP